MTHEGVHAVGIGTRVVADLTRRGEIVCVARNLSVQRGKDSHGWLDHAIACKINGGVLWGPTAGQIHGLSDQSRSHAPPEIISVSLINAPHLN